MDAKAVPVTDVVVVLPGIMGSTLAQNGRLVWAPSAGAVLRAIRTFGRSVKALTLPAGVADDHPADGVEPVALMPDLHLLPGVWTAHIGYDKLREFLRSPRFGLIEAGTVPPDQPVNLLPVPYDWRLSNRFNARRLKSIVEPALERWRGQGGVYENAGLVFICHSMGGLVARWYVEREGGAAHTRKLITLGTPHRGALTSLDRLMNGVRKGIGPLALNERGRRVSVAPMQGTLAGYRAALGPFAAGAYRVVVAGIGAAAARVASVTALTLVWEGGDV